MGGQFVVVSFNTDSSAGTIAAVSSDGTNWTRTTLPAAAGWGNVTFGTPGFVAQSGELGNTTIGAFSSDGTNWTRTTLPSSQGWVAVAFGSSKNLFCAIGDTGLQGAGTNAATSPDGITWTQQTVGTNNISGFGANSSVFAGVDPEGTHAAVSADGTTWAPMTMPAFGGTPGAVELPTVAWSPTLGIFAAPCIFETTPLGTVVALSANGTTWTGASIVQASYTAIAWGNGRFVALGGPNASGTSLAGTITAVSTDGTHWGRGTLPVNTFWAGVAYNGSTFCAIGSGSGSTSTVAATSTDGTHWTQQTLPASASWTGIAASLGSAQQGTAVFGGAGALSATAGLALQARAIFSGSGSLSVAGAVGNVGKAEFDAAGSLSYPGSLGLVGAATLSDNSPSLSAVAAVGNLALATFGGAGALSANGIDIPFNGAFIVFQGAGSFAANAQQHFNALATFAGSGVLTPTVFLQLLDSATFNGNGQMKLPLAGQSEFDGAGSLTVNTIYQPRIGFFAGSGSLSVGAYRVISDTPQLNGAGNLWVNGVVRKGRQGTTQNITEPGPGVSSNLVTAGG